MELACNLPAAAQRAQPSDERCADRRCGDATASTMPVREFPRQSIKIKFISMLHAGNSSFFPPFFGKTSRKNISKSRVGDFPPRPRTENGGIEAIGPSFVTGDLPLVC
jgi:hypothetical protein